MPAAASSTSDVSSSIKLSRLRLLVPFLLLPLPVRLLLLLLLPPRPVLAALLAAAGCNPQQKSAARLQEALDAAAAPSDVILAAALCVLCVLLPQEPAQLATETFDGWC
jgi:hypothetical protein